MTFLFQASLDWTLYVLVIKSQNSTGLPEAWGLALVWSLSSLALLPLLAGVIWYLTVASRGQIWVKVGPRDGLLNQLSPGYHGVICKIV